MKPTFLHVHRDDWKGECPKCLQDAAQENAEAYLNEDLYADRPEWPAYTNEYTRMLVEENIRIQEEALREELIRTWIISPNGPGLVKAILGDSELGQRLYEEIREESGKYLVETDARHSNNIDSSGSNHSGNNAHRSSRVGKQIGGEDA